eukprot:GEMP01044970.1.p1 GENE.GEMP01044970.1~~GEMP01044970.1.p1  ORF type:complete len:365 (+),score=58.03 GEMP01044970.1:96-1190(+)
MEDAMLASLESFMMDELRDSESEESVTSVSRTSMYNLLDFPREIKYRMLSFCPLQSILRLTVLCRECIYTLRKADAVWKVAFENQWPRLLRRKIHNDKEAMPTPASRRLQTPGTLLDTRVLGPCEDPTSAAAPSGQTFPAREEVPTLRANVRAPTPCNWRQAFKDRWISTGGKPEDNCLEDWADFDSICTVTPEEQRCTRQQAAEEQRALALRDFNANLRFQNCECALIGSLSDTCRIQMLMPHLYICQRTGMSHYCTIASGEQPCPLSVEDYRGSYTCRLTGISTIFAVEAEPAPPDEYEALVEDYMNEDMEAKQMLEREYERGYSMTQQEADQYFGYEDRDMTRMTRLENPNLCSRKRRRQS